MTNITPRGPNPIGPIPNLGPAGKHRQEVEAKEKEAPLEETQLEKDRRLYEEAMLRAAEAHADNRVDTVG